MKKVLYISYDGMTDPLGQSQVLPYLSGLSSEFEIHLLSCEKPKAFEKNEAIIQAICEKNNIHWHPTKYHKSPPVVSTLLDLQNLRAKAKKLHSKYNFDMTHCRSYIPAMIGLELKKKKGVKFLFDMRGFWADERKESGSWNTKNPLYKRVYEFFKHNERKFFSQADATISLTNSGKKAIENMSLKRTAPIAVIPTCADFEHFNYESITSEQSKLKRAELGYEERDFVLTYLGSLGGSYLMNEMIELYIEIKKINRYAKLLIITKSDLSLAKPSVEQYQLLPQDVKYMEAERKEIPLILSATDASVFFYRPTFSRKGTSPTKFAELLGLGIPVVGNKHVGDVEQIIRKNRCGVLVDVDEKDWNKKAAKELLTLAQKINKKEVRAIGIDNFNLQDGISKYKKIYKQIVA